MNQTVWTLTDSTQRVWQEACSLGAEDFGPDAPEGLQVRKQRLHGGLSDGVDLIELSTGALRVWVIPSRGMSLWRAEFNGWPLGWRSPVAGPVHPAFVNLPDYGGLGWLRGFDELVVRCGLSSNGAPAMDTVADNTGRYVEQPFWLHGRIANIPASYVAVQWLADERELRLRATVEEGMLFGAHWRLETVIALSVDRPRISLRDRIVNCRSVPDIFALLYHCNFGAPLLEAGSKLLLPVEESAPLNAHAAEDMETHCMYRGPEPGFVEQCYAHRPAADEHGWSLAVLRNAKADRGVALRFNVQQLPCFTQWKNTAAECDGYVTGLEPGVNYPNARPVEREAGRMPQVAPGESYSTELVLDVCDGVAAVAACSSEVDAIQAVCSPVLHAQPVSSFPG